MFQTVYSIVNKLSIDQLFQFDKRLRGKHMLSSTLPCNSTDPEAHKKFVINAPEARAPFMRFFLTHLYYTCSLNKPLDNSHTYIVDVNNIINHQNIIVCRQEKVMMWYYENRHQMSWEIWDTVKCSIDTKIISFIESRFDKDIPFAANTLVDKFYDIYINSSRNDIKELFEQYKENPTDALKVMHVSRIAYAIRTTHYFYIKEREDFEKTLYIENKDAISELVRLAKHNNTTGFIDTLKTSKMYEVPSGKAVLISYDKTFDGRHLNIRTKYCLSIKDILSGIIIQELTNPDLPFTEFYTLQLSHPILMKYTITVTPEERREILSDLLQS